MEESFFERVGGQSFFDDLVEEFYRGVETDLVLRPLYPKDLGDSKLHLALFLAQYWGGPEIYNEQRGHPRLRLRHAPFVIGTQERVAWLDHMESALDAMEVDEDLREELRRYLRSTAFQLMNAP